MLLYYYQIKTVKSKNKKKMHGVHIVYYIEL